MATKQDVKEMISRLAAATRRDPEKIRTWAASHVAGKASVHMIRVLTFAALRWNAGQPLPYDYPPEVN